MALVAFVALCPAAWGQGGGATTPRSAGAPAAVVPVELPPPGTATTVRVRLGGPERPAVLRIGSLASDAPASTIELTIPAAAADDFLQMSLNSAGRAPIRIQHYIRPNLAFYVGNARKKSYFSSYAPDAVFEEQGQVAAKRHLFRGAGEHVAAVRLESTAAGLGIWLDGRFIDRLRLPSAAAAEIALTGPDQLLGVESGSATENERFLAVDLRPYNRPGSARWGSMPVPERPVGELSKYSSRDEILWGSLKPGENVDVGLSRWLEQAVDPADFCDTYTTRSAFDGNPESIILRVPRAPYVRAYAIVAAEPDPAKIPAFSLRLTRFGNHGGDGGGRGDAFADVTVHLPTKAQDAGAGFRKLGEIEVNTSGVRQKVPLWQVEIALPVGQISDLLGDKAPVFGRPGDFLDLELTREIRSAVHFFSYQNVSLKPLGLPSAAHIFALTLEKSSVQASLSSSQHGNIFVNEKLPALQAELNNTGREAFNGKLTFVVTDFQSRRQEREIPVALGAAGQQSARQTLSLRVDSHRYGWFKAEVWLQDNEGNTEWREATTFALLPADTRKAGTESPFGTWWFGSNHGGNGNLEQAGSLLRKLGVRHIAPVVWRDFKGEELARYGLSYSMVPWYGLPSLAARDEFIRQNPGVKTAMLFHETTPSVRLVQMYPPELLGEPPPLLTATEQARMEELRKTAMEVARHYRAQHPGLQLSVGNSPSAIIQQLMRMQFPGEYIDLLGIEGVANWRMPERQPEVGGFQEVWWLKELKTRYGYKNQRLSSGFEWVTRCTQRGALSEADQAAYYVRDALHALAYGMPSINIGLLEDVADSYYATLYGAAGFVNRNPRNTPKPSYVAFATLTRELDGVRFQRYLETGSRSVYALEFTRGASHIYAIWVLRGQRLVQLALPRDASVKLTESMGNSRLMESRAREVSVTASPLPVYIECSAPLAQVTASLPEAEPAASEDTGPGPDNAPDIAVVDSLSDPGRWEVVPGRDEELETNTFDLPRREGRFTVRAVTDGEKGAVTELTLLPQPELPAVASRYVVLKPKQEIAVPHGRDRIGLWVKGNSCWGRVIWELKDAKGQRWISIGDEPDHWNVSDYESHSAINFDGWRYVSMPLPRRYPGGHHGPRDRDWKCSDRDGVLTGPLTFQRLIVEMRDQVVYVTEMVPVIGNSIRLKNLSVSANPMNEAALLAVSTEGKNQK